MYLYAALVPPGNVAERVSELVAMVQPDWTPAAAKGSEDRTSSSGRRFGRRRERETTTTAPPTGPLLDVVPPEQLQLPVARFGNLALADAAKLTAAMDLHARTWPAPELHLSGGLAFEPEGDNSVWIKVGGQLDALREVSQGVIRVCQGLQLFIDRRVFRPEIRVGTVNSRTTEAYLEQLLANLDGFQSPSWEQSRISLLIPADVTSGRPGYKTYFDIPLGGDGA